VAREWRSQSSSAHCSVHSSFSFVQYLGEVFFGPERTITGFAIHVDKDEKHIEGITTLDGLYIDP
jgi:hypothetical protein